MQNLKRYFPAGSDIFSVYSVIVFWAYSWCVLIFMFNFSSWILKVPSSEILGYFSYGLLFAFLDTLFMIAILLALSAILPGSWFRNDFVVSGTLAATSLFFWVTFFQVSFFVLMESSMMTALLILLVAVVILILSLIITRRFPLIRKAFQWFASACGVFIYVYGFLSVIGLVVVVLRNIF